MEHWDTVAAERLALADLLAGLSDEQWRTQSMCEAWTVRDVAAHLVLPHVTSIPEFMVGFVQARGSFHRANVAMTAKVARRPPPELVDALRTHAAGRFAPPGLGSLAPLTDVLIHGEDIRVPLGVEADRPASTWTPVLDFLVSAKAHVGFVSRSLRGFHFVASDTDWTHGDGAEVRGAARTLALAMAGRRAAADDLAGPGVGALVRH